VAAQYAAIAPGSAQTWLVKTTARLNCEAKRRDGGAARAQCYTCVGAGRDGHGDAAQGTRAGTHVTSLHYAAYSARLAPLRPSS
jgi:hypothetical protein